MTIFICTRDDFFSTMQDAHAAVWGTLLDTVAAEYPEDDGTIEIDTDPENPAMCTVTVGDARLVVGPDEDSIEYPNDDDGMIQIVLTWTECEREDGRWRYTSGDGGSEDTEDVARALRRFLEWAITDD